MGNISGSGSIGGEIINSFCRFLSLIYSLKIISISSDLKLVVKFFGDDFKTIGGSISISPPVGVPRFAHPRISIINNSRVICFIILKS